MLASEEALSGEGTGEGAAAIHDWGRERGEEMEGELLPAVTGWIGNCRERRFPWRTMSWWDMERACECMSEGSVVEVGRRSEAGCRGEETAAAPDGWARSLLSGVLDRFRDDGLCCARSMTSAPPRKKREFMPQSWPLESEQRRRAKRRREERRWRMML